MPDRSELQHLAARVLCCGFEGDDFGTLDALLDDGLGGVILFARNIAGGADELRELTTDLRRRAGDRPLLIAIDHEGGRVRRLREGFTPIPSMREIGRHDDANLTHDAGRLMGLELHDVGINVNFAPVVDVDSNPLNPVIGDRSFGRDPALVARMGVALIDGLQSAGVAACAKHFPGHGDTSRDSHIELPRLSHDLNRLRSVELPPFIAAAKVAASMMTAHVVFDALDPGVPATMSQRMLKLLREEIGFTGCVFSDCMEMAAIAQTVGTVEGVVRAIAAGVDCVLVSHTPETQWASHQALVAAVVDGRLDEARLRRAASAVDELATRFTHDSTSVDHEAIPALRRHVLARVGTALAASDPTATR